MIVLALTVAAVGWLVGYRSAGSGTVTVPDARPSLTVRPTTSASLGGGDPVAGKAVFESAGCGGCHTLAAAGSTGSVGPNLDEAKPGLPLVIDRVTNGQGVMPSFKGRLGGKQIEDVAAFVVKSTAGG